MSLLNRIATSNGDKARKAAAHRTLTAINTPKISAWNRRLRSEISRKRAAAQYPVEVGDGFIEVERAWTIRSSSTHPRL